MSSRGTDVFSKGNRNDRFKQMTKQQQLIEEKKRQIQEKLEEQKRKEAEEALKKIKSSEEAADSTDPNSWKSGTFKDGERPANPNIFSNDGSFLDQFRKLAGKIPGSEDFMKELRSNERDRSRSPLRGDAKSNTSPLTKPPPIPSQLHMFSVPPPLPGQLVPQNIPPPSPLCPQLIPPPRPLNIQNIPPPSPMIPHCIPPPPLMPCMPPQPCPVPPPTLMNLVQTPPPPPPPPPVPSNCNPQTSYNISTTYTGPPPPPPPFPPLPRNALHTRPPNMANPPPSFPSLLSSLAKVPPPPLLKPSMPPPLLHNPVLSLTSPPPPPPPPLPVPKPSENSISLQTPKTILNQTSSVLDQGPPPPPPPPPPVVETQEESLPTDESKSPVPLGSPPPFEKSNPPSPSPSSPTVPPQVESSDEKPVDPPSSPKLENSHPPELETSSDQVPADIIQGHSEGSVEGGDNKYKWEPIEDNEAKKICSAESGESRMPEALIKEEKKDICIKREKNEDVALISNETSDNKPITTLPEIKEEPIEGVHEESSRSPSSWDEARPCFKQESSNWDEHRPCFKQESSNWDEQRPCFKQESSNWDEPRPFFKQESSVVKDDTKTSESATNNQKAERERKRKSRWGDTSEDVKPPQVIIPPIISTIPTISVTGMSGPMLSKVNRTDPGLLQYAISAYGSMNLSDEDWKKAEDNYKVHLLYQDMMSKKAQVERLQAQGKNKYEYDSDEEVDGGTWEHKVREKEMIATKQWAESLTEMAKGKHHIGDFLPPDELKRFMDKYCAVKGGKEPDLSDYKEFKLKEDNKGFQMLQKLGWTEGQGLGSDGGGILDPINKAKSRSDNQGLGTEQPGDISRGDDEYDAYRKRMMLAYRFRPNPLNNPRRPYY